MKKHQRLSGIPCAIASLLGVVVAIGCDTTEPIRTYTVPKEASRTAAVSPATSANPTHRMLALIVPVGEQAWFFKVVGELEPIKQSEPTITNFFESLTFPEDAEKPAWETPEDWQEQAGAGMRAATFLIPAESGESLEMTVMKLPYSGLNSNVNRWRGQMALPQAIPAEIKDSTTELSTGDKTGTLVDLTGVFGDSGMSQPFAQQSNGASKELPPGHPPIAKDKAPKTPKAAGNGLAPNAPKMDVPADWQPGRMSAMRKAAFNVIRGENQAEITVMDFPYEQVPAMAETLPNVNRWRGEVGMEPIEEDELTNVTQDIEIDGLKATRVELIPKESESSRRATLAAMVKGEGKVWFFKLSGDRKIVTDEQENFDALLKSVEF